MVRVNQRRLSSAFLVFLALLPVAKAASPAAQLNLTEAERRWVEEHPTVTFTGDPNWLPYEAFDDEGNYVGIVAEHLEVISRLSGLSFQMSPSKTWTESTMKAKRGLVDVLSETDDSDLAVHLNFTTHYISNPIVIAMLNTENYVEGIVNIRGRKIALIKDYGYASKIRKKYQKIDFHTVEDIHDGLLSVSTGKVDALLCTLALCSYTIAEMGLNNVRITGKTEFDTKLALGVQKDLPLLLSILNKAIKNIGHEQQQEILDGWVKNKFVEKIDYTLVFQVIAVAAVLLGIFVLWNRRLYREINLRIAIDEERKQGEEEIQRLVSIVKHSTDFIGIADIEGRALFVNDAGLDLVGIKDDEQLHRTMIPDFLTESCREDVFDAMMPAVKNAGHWSGEADFLNFDSGAAIPVWCDVFRIDHPVSGEPINIATITRDRREQMRVDNELREYRENLEDLVEVRTNDLAIAREKAEALNLSLQRKIEDLNLSRAQLNQAAKLASIGEMSAGLAHEINQPLGAIQLNSEYLRTVAKATPEISNNAEFQQALDDNIGLVQRASAIVRHLNIYTRRSDKSTPDSISINKIINRALLLMQEDFRIRGIDLQMELASDLPPVKCNAIQIEQVFSNLLANARDAVKNTSARKINIKSYSEGGHLIVEVGDSGCGIAEEDLGKIFDPFYTTKDVGEGTGIGLSVTYSIIEEHGWELSVSSVVKQGTIFTVKLPVVAKAEDAT